MADAISERSKYAAAVLRFISYGNSNVLRNSIKLAETAIAVIAVESSLVGSVMRNDAKRAV